MKKLKALKGALIGVFVVAAACCVFAACSSDDDDDEVEVSYTPIDSSSIVDMKLDDSGVKKTYLTYQSFSSEGLEATATRESGAVEVMSASELDIDYSDFDSAKAGEYVIKVSYVENEYKFSTSYEVEVIEEIAGLTVTKGRVDYVIGDADGDGNVDTENENTTANISLKDLKVYAVTADGDEPAVVTTYYEENASENDGALDSGEYELKFFKGGEEISSLESLGVGIYTIYAYRDITITGKYSNIQYECGAYILCYVIDTPKSITLNVDEEETPIGVFEQTLGASDLMSGTWTFTLEYESGVKVQLTSSDVKIENLYPSMPSPNGNTARVTYTETVISSNGRQDVTLTVEGGVTYTVNVPEDGVTLDYALDLSTLVPTGAEFTSGSSTYRRVTADDFTGNNAFLAFTSGNSDDECVRDDWLGLKDGSLDVTFYGTGTLTVSFKSTNENNNSTLALACSGGTYIEGDGEGLQKSNDTTSGGNFKEYTVDGSYVYEVTGTTAYTVIYTIEEAGKYSIKANVTTGSAKPGRSTRITAIEMHDEITGNTETGDEGTVEANLLDINSVIEETLAFDDKDMCLSFGLAGAGHRSKNGTES